jgi:hypothetical protein
MRSRLVLALAAVAILAAVVPTSASAATEFGDACVANRAEDGPGIFEISAPGNPLPTAAPTNGVITQWKVNVISTPESIPTALKVVRVTDAGVLIVAEASGNATGGSNSFSTRIPVQAGDRLGIYGPSEIGSLYCETVGEEAHIAGFIPGPVGSTNPWEDGNAPLRVPLVAVLELDADNDGFGDETQDGCPQSAAIQVPCPMVALSTSTQVKKNSVTVIVTSSAAAPVTVKGVAKLGKGKKAKLNGGTQNLIPGTLSKFKLFFTKGLKNKLKETSPKERVKLKVTVSGTSVSGTVTKKTLNLKLKGQG